MSNINLILIERIEKAIYLIRGEKVELDCDLAKLYDVSTAAFNQAVRRNRERFPEDFMFQLTPARSIAPLVIDPMLLPNRALQCYRVCYEASARSPSTLK